MQAAGKLFCHTKCLNYCRRLSSRNQLLLLTHSAVSKHQLHGYSTAAPDVLPPPAPNSSLKLYSPKIQKLVDDISQLTLLEVADLNELLKKTLNIQDAPVMAVSGTPVAAQKEEEEEAAPKREKVNFTVRLIGFDSGKKVQLIKEIKNVIEGLNLVQAKKFVESTPQVVKADISKEEAEKLKELLVASGAEIALD